MRLPARVALTDAQRTCSPRRASTRACTSRACIGWRSSARTLEMASMSRPCRGWAAPTAVPGVPGAHVRGSALVSRPVLGCDGTPPSKDSSGAGGLEWCPLRSIRGRYHNDPAAKGHVLMSGRSALVRAGVNREAAILRDGQCLRRIPLRRRSRRPAEGRRDARCSSFALVSAGRSDARSAAEAVVSAQRYPTNPP